MDQSCDPPVPTTVWDQFFHGCGLGRHGPASLLALLDVAHGYAVVAPPWIRGRGAPSAARSLVQRPAMGWVQGLRVTHPRPDMVMLSS